MKFIVADDYDQMSRLGAEIFVKQIKLKCDSVLGFATGSTPIGLYRYLIDEYRKGLDFSKIITFNLDEYYGLSPDHPQSYRYFMDCNLFSHINIDKRNIHIPNGLCEDIEEECARYDSEIAALPGIDLQVLGIGRNGHIGFNEPSNELDIRTHMTKLSEDTIEANSRFFNSIEEVPRYAITMGMGTIMKAKKILLLASGTDKAPVIERIIKPFVDTDVPASMLQLHNDVTVIVDRDAASLMKPEVLYGLKYNDGIRP